jgi:hypothetical protein
MSESPSEQMQAAIGRALAFWQAVETALYYAVHCILASKREYSATVFYAIRSPEAKMMLPKISISFALEKGNSKNTENLYSID